MTQPAPRQSGLLWADALPVLGAYVVVLMGIPSELVFHPLGAAGTPAQIIGIAMLAWWLASRLVARSDSRLINPVKVLMLLLVLAIVGSYVAGMCRPITFSDEVRSADRAMLSLCAWSGVALVTADGLSSRRHLDSFLRIIAGGAVFIAVLGLLQFFLKLDLAHYIRIPGLSANHAFGQLLARSSFQRVNGTTSHPIEFGVVLSCTLPLLIHFARFSDTVSGRRRWWAATAVVAAVLPMSVARSAILGAAIVFVYLFYTWPAQLRIRIAGAIGVGAVGMSFAVPGLLGTIRGLFLNASSDPSTAGRTADYAPVIHYVAERPLFGQGIGTYIPSIYRTLDNQYLGTVVEAGIVGLIVLLALFIGTNCVAGSIRRQTESESVKNLAQSLKAGIAVLAINSASFDTFGFSMAAGMIFLLVGAVGALWGIQPHPARRPVVAPSRRRRVVAAVVAGYLVVAGAATYGVRSAQPEYQAYGTILLVAPAVHQTAFATTARSDYAASVLHDIMASRAVHETIGAAAPRYEVALENGSLAEGSDVIGTGGPSLRFKVESATSAGATQALSTVLAESGKELNRIQQNYGVVAANLIRIDILQQTSAFPVQGRPTRAQVGLLLLLVILGLSARNYIRVRTGFNPIAALRLQDRSPSPKRRVAGLQATPIG